MEKDDRTIFELIVDENTDAWSSRIDKAMEEFAHTAERHGEIWSVTDGDDYFVNLKVVNQLKEIYRQSAKDAMADKNLDAADVYAQVAYTLVALMNTTVNHSS